jgi:putative endonuclease
MNQLGQIGEEIAAQHYQQQGWEILTHNYIFPKGKRTGELDLIAVHRKSRVIAFVEVKTRRSNIFGQAVEAVDDFKKRRLLKTVKLFLQANPEYQEYDCRIDVAAVDIDNPTEPVIIIPDAIEDESY